MNNSGYYSSTEYPELVEYAIKQQHSHWLHTDPNVSNDLHSMLVELTSQERESIIEVLKLFVHYELRLGSNFWSALGNTLPRAEVYRMCSTFANMEIAVHSPFYAEVNRILNINTPEFYLAYKANPVLVDRMNFLDKHCRLGKKATVEEILLTLATLTFVEGVVLYSSFALLKSFQANGNNSIPSIVTGVDYVTIDEQLHCEGSSLLFNTLLDEADLTEQELKILQTKITKLAIGVKEHESEIIKIIFKEGDLPSIKQNELETFIESRVDLCLKYLGCSPIYLPKDNKIAQWFYRNINSPKLVDFFNRNATSYTRNWNEDKLGWINE